MDSYAIKLSGSAELPKQITMGHNFRVLLEGSIVEERIKDNDDGSKTHYYIFTPVLVETLDDKGERLRAKDVRSVAKRLRSRVYLWWKEHLDRGKTQDECYEWFGERAIQSLPEIMDLLEAQYGKME